MVECEAVTHILPQRGQQDNDQRGAGPADPSGRAGQNYRAVGPGAALCPLAGPEVGSVRAGCHGGRPGARGVYSPPGRAGAVERGGRAPALRVRPTAQSSVYSGHRAAYTARPPRPARPGPQSGRSTERRPGRGYPGGRGGRSGGGRRYRGGRGPQ